MSAGDSICSSSTTKVLIASMFFHESTRQQFRPSARFAPPSSCVLRIRNQSLVISVVWPERLILTGICRMALVSCLKQTSIDLSVWKVKVVFCRRSGM